MLELGEHAAGMHAECGEAAAALGIDVVVGVRGNARYLVDAAAELGVRGVFVEDAGAAGEWLVRNLRPGDAVLVKGSRGVRLEVAIAALRKELKG
jgi:UDP-N-acetylmuramoyl-tripeptide--D-alanyl-D-alanine ligase